MAWSAIITRITSLIPGVGLSIVVTLVSLAVQYLEERFLSHPYLEALVIAILPGMAVRSVWEPNPRWRPGIAFSAKQLLEVAVVLVGAPNTFFALFFFGPPLFFPTLAAPLGLLVAACDL